jgi:hypothetical protein
VIDRGHVDEESAGQRDVTRDARAFFTKRFFCNLNYYFLAGLQHFGNELRAAVLFVPRMAVLRRLMGASSPGATALRAVSSAAHGTLEAGARLFGNPRACGRLTLARRRRSWGLMEFSASLAVFLRVYFPVIAFVTFRVLFAVFFRVTLCVSFFVTVPWWRLRGQRFVMHFVGKGVGFLGRVFVFVFLIVLVITFLIVFLITFLIGVQRFLQLFEFGGLYVRFGNRFDRLRALFGIGLRFFVLGFGKLLGERGYVFLGEACAVRGVRVR